MSENGQVRFKGDADEPITAVEQLLDVMSRLSATLDRVQDDTKKTGDETTKTEKKLSSMEKATSAVNARWAQMGKASDTARNALGIVAKGAGAVLAAMTAATVGVYKLSQAGSEQERVNDRLSGSIKGLTDDAEKQREIWGKLQEQITQASQVDTDFSDEEISDTLANLIRLTGDYEKAQASLDTVMGISAAKNKSLEEATNAMGKARKGNIEALQELTPLSANQLKTLQAITSDQERGAAAAEILTTAYAGLANTGGTAGGAMKDLQDAGSDVVQMIGMLINASGAVQAIVNPLTEALRGQESAMAGNSRQGQLLALTIADYVVASLDVMIEIAATGAKYIYGVEAALKVGAGSMELFGRAVIAGAETVLYFAGEVLSVAIGRLESYLDTSAKIAGFVGADGMAGELRVAAQAAQGFRDEVDKFSSDRIEGMKTQFQGMDTAIDGQADAMLEMDRNMQGVEETMGKAFAVTDKMRAGLASARLEVVPLSDGFNAAASNAGELANQVERVKEATTGMSMEEANLRAIILDIEREILTTTAEGERAETARLEKTRAQYASELELLGAKDKSLGRAAQENALLEASLRYRQQMADLTQAANAETAVREVYTMRLAALQTEDELQRTLLEIEADRYALQYERLSDEERAYEVARLRVAEEEAMAAFGNEQADASIKVMEAREQEVQAALRLATQGSREGIDKGIDSGSSIRQAALQERINDLKEIEGELAEREIERTERLIELERQRAAAMKQTAAGVTDLAGFMATLSTQQWDLVAGQESYIGALGAAGQIGAGISSLLIKDRAKLAAVEAIIQTGLGIGATAAFIKSGGLAVNYGAAAVQHFSAAASMGVAAARGGESAATGASGGGGGAAAGGFSSTPPPRPESDTRSLTRDLTDAVREGFNGGGGSGATNYVDMRGALIMADSPQGRSILTDNVLSDLDRRGILTLNALDRP